MKTTEIRELYPRPVICGLAKYPKGYCVGGAFLLAHGIPISFPSPDDLADALRRFNPDGWTAGQIIYHNELGEFEEAWAELEGLIG